MRAKREKNNRDENEGGDEKDKGEDICRTRGRDREKKIAPTKNERETLKMKRGGDSTEERKGRKDGEGEV